MKDKKYRVKALYPGSCFSVGDILEWDVLGQTFAKVIGTTREGEKIFGAYNVPRPSNYPAVFEEQ